MHSDNWLLYYSPPAETNQLQSLQTFTGIGQLDDDDNEADPSYCFVDISVIEDSEGSAGGTC